MEQRKLFDGRYRLVRPLGRGAVGQLWLARDTWSSGVQVALKRPAQPASATAGPTLESEFRILREARHPHIATAYDFGRLPDGACYFTLEYVAGPDIGTASRRVPLKVLIDRLIETCLALAAVHAAGYVHGDVKPANILVSRVGAPAVKLVDFGHAVPRGHQGLRLRGTPGLIAPEVATGARVDAVTDLFSLGGTITRLLASRPSRESEGVAELARRLAAPRPQDRPESALAAAAALEAARPRDRAARRGATLVADLALAPPQVPLIGRDPQLRQLNALLGTTIEHACLSLAVVTGTPGAGKTRLLDAFRTIGQLRGCLAISLTCARAGEPASAGEPHPSKTISQLLERLVLALPPDAESLARCGPELLKLAPHLRDWQAFGAAGSREAQPEPAGRPLPPKQEQARQRDRLAWFVAQQARRRPLVLELRDVQQAGPDIQDLVRALASGADSSPILIILTVDAPRSEARSWIRDLAVRSRLDLSLPGLSPGATRRFVNVLLRSRAWNAAPPSRALVRAIHERTGGLPGQVVELTRAILASGGLRRWDCPEAIQVLPMPRELDEILAQRLGHVGPSERTLLELLAHADPPVGPGLLEHAWRRLVGRGARSPGPPLLHLAQNRLLTRSEQTSVEAWEFADPRFAAVLRSRCPAARSRRMHRALADALADAARRTPRGAAVRVQLDAQRAGHCLAGGDDEAAVLLARRAAAGLKVRHGYREALALLRRALPAVARWARRDPAHAGRLEVEILLEAAELALLLGDVAQEQTLIAKLNTRARRARLSALECARLERRQGVLAMLAGRHSRSAPHFNRAERSLAKPARGTSAVDVLRERLRLVASRAMLHVHQGSAPRALEICTSALAPFSKTTPGGRRRNRRAAAVGPEIASLLNWRAIALIYSGEPEQAVASWEEASAAYHAADEPIGEAGVLNNLGKFHMDRGDLRRARRRLTEAVARRHELGDVDGVADSLNNLGIVEIMAGHLPKARSHLNEGLRLRWRMGDRFGEVLARANLAEVDLLSAHYAPAIVALEQALAFMQAAGHVRLGRGLLNSLAAAHLAVGRTISAGQLARRAAAGGAEMHDALQDGLSQLRLGEIALEQAGSHAGGAGAGRRALGRARRYLLQARETFRRLPHRYHEGMAVVRLIQADLAGTPPRPPHGQERTQAALPVAPALHDLLAELAKLARDLGSASLQAWHELLAGELLLLSAVPAPGSGAALLSEQHERALAGFGRAAELAVRFDLRELLWRAQLHCARVWSLAGRPRRAHNHLAQALEALAAIQRELPVRRWQRSFLHSQQRAQVQNAIAELAQTAGVAETEAQGVP